MEDVPTEIWQMIWRRSWKPRIVEIHSFTEPQPGDDDSFFNSIFDTEEYRSSARLPVSLFINKASREFSEKHYEFAFPAVYLDPRSMLTWRGTRYKEERVRFNFEIDTLYIKDPEMFWTSRFLSRLRKCDGKLEESSCRLWDSLTWV